ncbi:hypothetical protein J6590_054743 [Homalodisca vitripennis]|nr:hypothetical protein J6590_054743 [Homalodisca vitripennis]
MIQGKQKGTVVQHLTAGLALFALRLLEIVWQNNSVPGAGKERTTLLRRVVSCLLRQRTLPVSPLGKSCLIRYKISSERQ